jgi:hypothetical protein
MLWTIFDLTAEFCLLEDVLNKHQICYMWRQSLAKFSEVWAYNPNKTKRKNKK